MSGRYDVQDKDPSKNGAFREQSLLRCLTAASSGAQQNGGVERKKTPFLNSYKDI